jgi:acyl dehydratase
MNTALVGRTYGPYRYEVGAEKIREFALAIGGGIPSAIYAQPMPADLSPAYWDEAFAKEHGGLVAPPTFCVNFAIKPFVACTADAELGLDLLMLVHGEQEFEFDGPVRAGDVLETTGTIAELYEKSGKDFVVMKTVSRNQHGREAVRGTWTAVIRK